MAKEQVLAKGLRFFDKHPSSPDFVLGTIVITAAEINTMFTEQREYVTQYNGMNQLKLQLLKSKDGKMYATVDTYKKDTKPTETHKAAPVKNTIADNDDSGLPF